MEENEFALVYTAGQNYQALLVKGLLEENGIEATVINKKDSELIIGFAEVYVRKEDKERALQILGARES
jgi:aspartokinase